MNPRKQANSDPKDSHESSRSIHRIGSNSKSKARSTSGHTRNYRPNSIYLVGSKGRYGKGVRGGSGKIEPLPLAASSQAKAAGVGKGQGAVGDMKATSPFASRNDDHDGFVRVDTVAEDGRDKNLEAAAESM